MTAKQLRGLLEGVADDLLVVQSKDGEGNSFSPFSQLSLGQYQADYSAWSGEFTDCPEDMTGPINAVCLWPTN